MNYICVYIVYLFATNCAIISISVLLHVQWMPLYWVAAKAGLLFFVSFGQEQDHATSKNIMLLVNWVKDLFY